MDSYLFNSEDKLAQEWHQLVPSGDELPVI